MEREKGHGYGAAGLPNTRRPLEQPPPPAGLTYGTALMAKAQSLRRGKRSARRAALMACCEIRSLAVAAL